MKTFLGAPVRHLGETVGNIYLTEKEGGREFTPEDEDTLVCLPLKRQWPSPTH